MSKFSNETCEELWELTMEDSHDAEYAECGNVADGAWYGLLTDSGVEDAEHAIVMEDDQGFVTYETFENADDAKARFKKIQEEIAAEFSEDE